MIAASQIQPTLPLAPAHEKPSPWSTTVYRDLDASRSDMLASDETLPHRQGITALPTESTHIEKYTVTLKTCKENRTRNTKTRHGTHTGSRTERRRICALLWRKPCCIGEGKQSFREIKSTGRVCRQV